MTIFRVISGEHANGCLMLLMVTTLRRRKGLRWMRVRRSKQVAHALAQDAKNGLSTAA